MRLYCSPGDSDDALRSSSKYESVSKYAETCNQSYSRFHTSMYRRMFRMSPAEIAELKTQVTKLLAQGIIRPFHSPYGAPFLFFPKKTEVRFCVDFRALNKLTIKDKYPIPRIDDILDAARGAQCFSSLDLTQSYYPIGIEESDIPKTAFTTPLGHFEWTVLVMGLTNSPSSFSRVIQSIFRGYDFILTYLDDGLILSKSPEEHLRHLRTVFELLRKYRLFAKGSKCQFFKKSIHFLGHICGGHSA